MRVFFLPPSRPAPAGAARTSPPRPFQILLPALLLALLVGSAALLAGCSEDAEPVAKLSVEPGSVVLPYPETRELEVRWDAKQPVEAEGELRLFVHLLDAEGGVERTFDQPFPRPWTPGQPVVHPVRLYQSMLAPPLPEGEYALTFGLHDAEDRWPLDAGPEAGKREYRMATVRVPPPRMDELPRLGFLGEWSPLQPGSDRQILGSRWLGREGIITVQEARKPGTLGLLFDTPEAPAGVERVMEEGAEEPSLRVISTCDGSERRLSGTGLSRMEVEVPVGEPCEIRLQPSFHFDDPDHQGRAAHLLLVTWNPQEG